MKEYKIKVNGTEYEVTVNDIENGIARVSVNGTAYNVEVGEEKSAAPVFKAPVRHRATASATTSTATPAAGGAEVPVKSPLPGVILEVKAAVGTTVTAGQTIMVLEAMKMENNIDAPQAGVIKSFAKAKGDSVLEGDVLFTIE